MTSERATGLVHASFFSGVGGLDLGLERAGWRTVVFHEIEPYASAVLNHHWPQIPNGGCIFRALGAPDHDHGEKYECLDPATGKPTDWPGLAGPWSESWADADLFSGGFPCQDLSIAGKRKGLAGHRSGLAFAFLALVERYRPRAVLLENVPGLLSSHRGKDLGVLLGLLGQLGYGWAFRVLDARFFGVPQRRKRVFIVALRSGDDDPDGHLAAERAAEVLAVGTRCPWHPAAGTQAGPVPAGGPGGRPERYGVEYVGAWQAGPHGHHGYDQASVQGHLVSHALTAQHTTGRLDPNGETFVVADGVHALEQRQGQRDEPLGGDRAAPDAEERDGVRHGGDELDGAAADPGGDGAPDGLAGRLDHRARLEGATAASITASAGHHGHSSPRGDGSDNLVVSPTLRVGATRTADGGPGDTVPVIAQHAFVKSQRAREKDGEEKWVEEDVAPTLNTFDTGDTRAVTLVAQEVAHTVLGKPNSSHAEDMDTYVVAATLNSGGNDGGFRTEPGEHLVTMGTLREHVRPGSNTDQSVIAPVSEYDDPLLPEGLDSHRYRCCGNGVVASVADWIGFRLAAELSTVSTSRPQ